ncbi:MAG: hypothetical protein QM775_09355 [Pirellulales bacterium]
MNTPAAPERPVDIRFECLPLRSISRFDVPLDASPRFRARCERIESALGKHGSLNTYYLHDGRCRFRLTNSDDHGVLEFAFEGTLTTDPADQRTVAADLQIDLRHETCVWLTEPIVAWLKDSVARAVMVDFDRYIAEGDVTRTQARLLLADLEWEQRGGFVGMGL